MNPFKRSLLIFFNLFSAFSITEGQIPANPFKAPLYWSVYENHILQDKAGVSDNFISEEDFLSNINWINDNLKDYGYSMICIDGWGDVKQLNANGYRTSHSSNWTHDFQWWSQYLQNKGMTLGMYANPLWVHVASNDTKTLITGTNIPVSTLLDPSEIANFPWCQVDHPGAEEYVKGYIQFFADMGVKYLRVDFLSWYENGQDRWMGRVGPDRPHEFYETALRWMREACDANGMFLSLVMPHLFNDAETELKYGEMIRINEDCGEGEWYRFSDMARGEHREGWSQYANVFDGYIYWSKISGREKMILDGDFIRLNTFSSPEERKSVVSLHLLAGGPLSIADQWNTIGASTWIYKNRELLELNADGFAGKPLSDDPQNDSSQIWTGQMSNGDWIVGFFNRESVSKTRQINFQDLCSFQEGFVRDLWGHSDLGVMSSISTTVLSHRCMVYRISAAANRTFAPVFSLKGGSYPSSKTISISTPTPDASIFYTLDGSLPTSGSTTYTQAVEVAASAQLRAIAMKEGMQNSYVSEDFYFIGEAPPQGGMYIGGTFNSWNLVDCPMKYAGNNNWISDAIAINAGAQSMKFANQNNWKGSDWGFATGLTGTARLTTGSSANLTFTAPETGDYIFSFNDYTLQYSIKKTFNSLQDQMYIAGSFNSWNLSEYKMSLSADNIWTIDSVYIPAGSQMLKFANSVDWSGIDWGRASGLTGTAKVSTGGLPNISFSAAKTEFYTIEFNDKTLVYSIVGITTDIKQVEASEIKVFPNPARDILFVTFGKETKAKISVYNSLGELVHCIDNTGTLNVIKMTDLDAKGLLIVKVTTSDYSKSFKISVL